MYHTKMAAVIERKTSAKFKALDKQACAALQRCDQCL